MQIFTLTATHPAHDGEIAFRFSDREVCFAAARELAAKGFEVQAPSLVGESLRQTVSDAVRAACGIVGACRHCGYLGHSSDECEDAPDAD